MVLTTDLPIVDGHLHFNSDFILRSVGKRRPFWGGLATTIPSDWKPSLELAKQHGLGICLGIHPWFVEQCNETDLEELKRLLTETPHAQIGECGLHRATHYRQTASLELQIKYFNQQIQFAHQFHRNLCIHSWGYDQKTLDLLQKSNSCLFYWHGINCSPEVLQEIQNRKMIVGLGAQIWKWKQEKRESFLRTLDPQLIMIESDSPYLMKDKVELDIHVKQLSQSLGISCRELLQISMINWKRFYNFTD